jgi:hypothetical protein
MPSSAVALLMVIDGSRLLAMAKAIQRRLSFELDMDEPRREIG